MCDDIAVTITTNDDTFSETFMDVDTDLEVGSNVTVADNAETIQIKPSIVVEKDKRNFNVQWCSAIKCKNNRFTNSDLSFFRFPKDEDRCKKVGN